MENRVSKEAPSNSSPSLVPKLSPFKRPIVPPLLPSVLHKRHQADDLRFRDSPHLNDAVSFGGNGFGVFSRKGKKKFMEDTHRIAPCSPGSSNKSFFGVYDGHGGAKAADSVAENLHKHVLEMVKNCKEKGEKEEAFRAAYLRTDRDFLQEGVGSGTCCVTALIQNQEIIVSNLEDCRAVLSRGGGVAEALTADNRLGRDDERQRIENQGGYVDFHRGAWRVYGTLAVSRSIGDAHLKKWIVAEPDTRILELEEDMEFLVLASDGLWDVVSNQEAVETVLLAQRKTPRESEDENLTQGLVSVSPSSKLRRVSLVKQREELLPAVQSPKCAKPISCHQSENESPRRETGSPPPMSPTITALKSSWAKAACKELVDLGVSRGSRDDITVVIIDLNHYKW